MRLSPRLRLLLAWWPRRESSRAVERTCRRSKLEPSMRSRLMILLDEVQEAMGSAPGRRNLDTARPHPPNAACRRAVRAVLPARRQAPDRVIEPLRRSLDSSVPRGQEQQQAGTLQPHPVQLAAIAAPV